MAKLLVLAHRVPFPPNKGEKLRTFHQIEELVRKGHSVTVLAPYEDEADLVNAKSLARKFSIEVICKKLPNRLWRLALAALKNRSFSETNFYSKNLLQVLREKIRSADVLLVTASSLANYVFKLPNTKNTLLLMDFMDVDSDKWQQYANESSVFKRLLYSREASKICQLERRIAKTFDASFVIAQTEKNLFELKVSNEGVLKVLGNGIDQSLFNPSENKSVNLTNFLFSGVMDYKPNIDAVLWFVENCWDDIQAQVPNAKLIIAGMNPSPIIVKLGRAANIEVTGFVEDIKPYFDQAHVFIAPFQIARGVQNKVLQAMACALPVVCTPLGAEGILCQHDDDIVIANNADEFTKEAIELAKNLPLRKRIGQQALSTINTHYGWESVLKPLTEIISKK